MTELVFVLDRSGSMAGTEQDTIGGFNAMIEKQRKKPGAAVVSTVLFSLIHINNYIGYYDPLTMLLSFVQYIPAGICLAAAYEISGSIFAPVLIHTAVNAVGMLAVR